MKKNVYWPCIRYSVATVKRTQRTIRERVISGLIGLSYTVFKESAKGRMFYYCVCVFFFSFLPYEACWPKGPCILLTRNQLFSTHSVRLNRAADLRPVNSQWSYQYYTLTSDPGSEPHYSQEKSCNTVAFVKRYIIVPCVFSKKHHIVIILGRKSTWQQWAEY